MSGSEWRVQNSARVPFFLGINVLGWSGWRESNPRVQLGKLTGYHYITPAKAPPAP
jgi:hypothetical protein